jgi:hypothetical protein
MEQVIHRELRVILTRYACRLPNQAAPQSDSLLNANKPVLTLSCLCRAGQGKTKQLKATEIFAVADALTRLPKHI